MASFRRALSMPAPQTAGELETHAMISPSPLLSKSSSSSNSDHHPISFFPRSFHSLEHTLYEVQTLVLGFFSKRSSSKNFDRLKSKGNIWRRALFHFQVWFLVGVFIGFTPLPTPNFSIDFLAKTRPFSYDKLQEINRIRIRNHVPRNPESNNELGRHRIQEPSNSTMKINKLLIIVTPIQGLPFEVYYLNRLANTLRLVPPPMLWIVVEMAALSLDIAELLRNSGVMFRHLVCRGNSVDMADVDRAVLLRNLVLSHVEKHRLDGVVFWANYDNVYTIDLFDQMRQIRRLGAWTVANVGKERTNIMAEGPVCNGSKVIGWHTNEKTVKFKRFYVELSGFAFSSSILWDPSKRSHKPKRIRFLRTLDESLQTSTFIGQIVEDESQIEGFPVNCSKIMVWHFNMETFYDFLARKSEVLPYWFNGLKNLPL